MHADREFEFRLNQTDAYKLWLIFECMKTPAALLGNINNSDEQMMSVVCSGAVGSGVWPRVESPVHNLNSIHGLPAGLSGFWTTFRQVLP